MPVSITTPTGTLFKYEIEFENERIAITTENGNQHSYALRALRELYQWLKNDRAGAWVDLGSKGEEETPNSGTVEEWARSDNNPMGGHYGLTPGRRGRFASYVPSILEHLGFVEVEHKPKNNRVRAR